MSDNLVTDDATEVSVTLDELIGYLDKDYELVYIDYRDNMDEQMQAIQDAIHADDMSCIDESLDEWMMDAESDGVVYIINQVTEELANDYDIDKDYAEELVEPFLDDLRDTIYERNTGDPVRDLLRNTSDPVCFYDTGLDDVPETWCLEKDEWEEYKDAIRSVLGIDGYDKDLDELLANASYGGRLVIYFRMDCWDLLHIVGNTVTFTDPHIALIDTYNGSGHDVWLKGATVTLPFDRTNLFIDRTIKYNYTYEVCGMYSSWCDETRVSFSTVDNPAPVVPSSLHREMEVEKLYIQAFKAGGCTHGDMDMRRHRNTYYLNEFPCGTHCPHCGTFWID